MKRKVTEISRLPNCGKANATGAASARTPKASVTRETKDPTSAASSCERADAEEATTPDATCRNCGKTGFCTGQALYSHQLACHKGSMVGLCVSLRPPSLNDSRIQLSEFNWKVTEAIELIEVSPEDISELAKTVQRGRTPRVGDIGIRCVYCARKGIQPAGSNVYPKTLKSLPHNMYNLVVRHLLGSCQNIPKATQDELSENKTRTTKQSMMKDRIGLPVYLQMLTELFALTDLGEAQGIRRVVE